MSLSQSPDDPPTEPSFEDLVQLPEVQLFVRRFGATGPDLIIIHGGPDWDHSYFLPFVLPLATHMRVTLFDLRGCGRSQKFNDPTRYHLDHAVDDVARLCQQLSLVPATLLGFSYGGRIALRLADRYPHLVGKLILASTTAYDDFTDDLEQWDEYRQRNDDQRRASLAALLASPDLSNEEKTRTMAHLSAPLNIYDLSLLEQVHEVQNRIAFSGEWMAAWLEGKLAGVQHAEYGARLAELAIPVLILHGEKDMGFPVSVAQRLYTHLDHLPHTHLVTIPATGHFAHIEATDTWNAAVLHFMQSAPRML
ncbi:MAG: alpha/beta fold hydrolase [Ktedonobacterales bacterium]